MTDKNVPQAANEEIPSTMPPEAVQEQGKITVSTSLLAKQSVYIATPMYGNQCFGLYAKSILQTILSLQRFGIENRYKMIFNESLITRARNYAADEFMRGNEMPDGSVHKCEWFLFIDADLAFEPDVVISMLAIGAADPTKKIITAPYPKKDIAWEKVKAAVDQGLAEDNPDDLANFVGDFVINTVKDGPQRVRLDQPIEVAEAGTGMMLIHRSVLEDLNKARPDLLFKPDHIRDPDFNGSRMVMAYFDTEIDPVSKRYLSEDYFFCKIAREIGHKVWLCPWMQLTHIGNYHFKGNLPAVARLNMSLTAQPDKLGYNVAKAAEGNRKERRKNAKLAK